MYDIFQVQTLLALKAEFKKVTGTDWTPNTKPVSTAIETSAGSDNINSVLEKIAAQGDKIRQLKSEKADKKAIEPEVQALLALKAEYKKLSGKDWTIDTKPIKASKG